jgi:hypothetical protein
VRLVAPLPQARLAVAAGAADSVVGLDDPALVPLFLEGRPLRGLPPAIGQASLGVVWLHGGEVIGANLARLGVGRVLTSRALPDPDSGVHAADWLLGTLAPLGVAAPAHWDGVPWLATPAEGQAEAGRWLGTRVGGGPFAVLHPGSGSGRKNWPAPAWAEVVAGLTAARPLRLVVTAGPADDAPLEALLGALAARAGATGPAGGVEVLRQPDLPLLAGVLQRASLYLGNDSGVSHLAAGLGTPAVAVFGVTDPTLWRPRGPRVRVLGDPAAGWPEPAAVLAAALDLAGQPGAA